MKLRRTPTQSASVSLFPFLAVLICTMGSLILLLVVIARQARVRATETASAARASSEDLRKAWNALQEEIAALQASRSSIAAQLTQSRRALSEQEAVIRQLEAELASLERERAVLEEKLAGSTAAGDQAELERLTARAAELQKLLAEARRKAQTQPPSYAIVPYNGPNQTRRRPIYIECRSDRIVLQPEGIILTAKDFDGPLDNSNALASAVRAAEQYLGRNSRSNLRDPGEPYPFLVVRPDGINSYYIARAALRSWGSDFGYELVDAEWELDFKDPDPGLLTAEANAVEEARQRQLILGYAGSGRGESLFRGLDGPRHSGGSASSGDGEDEPRGRYRVSADGRVVREFSPRAAAVRPRVGGSRLSRYSEITGGSDTAGQSAAAGGALHPGMESFGTSPGDVSARDAMEKFPASQTGELAGSSAAENAAHDPAGHPSTAAATGNPVTAATAPNATALSNRATPGMSSPDSPAAMASDEQGPQILPQRMFGQQNSMQGAPAVPSLAESHGSNWALPDASRGAIPVTRPIGAEVREDRIIVLPEVPGGPGGREIPFNGQTTSAVSGLISAVWDRMDGWGIAGKGMYWRPELHVRSTPGAAQRLAELKALLADSGIIVVERPPEAAARSYGGFR